MQNLPKHLIQYQLLPFCNTTCAVKLTQASQTLFNMLRYKIGRTVGVESFICQSHKQSIGGTQDVLVTNKDQLTRMLKHIADFANEIEVGRASVWLYRLLHLVVWFDDESLDNIVLPATLQTLWFVGLFNQSLSVFSLPASLQTLKLGHYFTHPVTDVTWPPTLHTLAFGFHFNQPLDQVTLPDTLTSLTFGSMFNQPLDNIALLVRLRTLILGHDFDQSLVSVQFLRDLVIRKRGLVLAAHLLPPGLYIEYF